MFTSCNPTPSAHQLDIDLCLRSLAQSKNFFVTNRLKVDGSLNEIDYTTINVKATWDALFAQSDETKLVVTPEIVSPVMSPSEPRLGATGNDAPAGLARVLGSNPQSQTFKFEGTNPLVADQAKALSGDLAFYFLDIEGQIGGRVDDLTTPTMLRPIPLRDWFIGDRTQGNYGAVDYYPGLFNLVPGWSNNFHIFKPTAFDFRSDFAF